MGRWRKLGNLYRPSGTELWMHSHAAVPVAEHISGTLYRIYFSSRDKNNRSTTCALVIDLERTHTIVDLSTKPIIEPGALGAFDDSGAMATWLTVDGDRRLLWYIGWNLGVTVPFRNAIGLAISENNGPFRRLGDGPVLDRTLEEPYFCASCCVLRDGNLWRNWYLSCTGWDRVNDRIQHRYHIKYAESSDGIRWNRNGDIAIPYASSNEYAISRPSVIRDFDGWHMWYSHRGEQYRIGYARSDDGRCWERRDRDVGIDVSPGEWDGHMIEYPYVFQHGSERFMLYNGDGYGYTGFGLAVWES